MREYTPDHWVIVEFSGTKVPQTYRRVLAGWYGGFVSGDSWKMSSGVEDMIDRGTYWEIPNHSGSVYICHKNNEGFSGYLFNIFSSYASDNSEEITMTRIVIGEE